HRRCASAPGTLPVRHPPQDRRKSARRRTLVEETLQVLHHVRRLKFASVLLGNWSTISKDYSLENLIEEYEFNVGEKLYKRTRLSLEGLISSRNEKNCRSCN